VSWVKEAGFEKVPDDIEGFIKCAKALKAKGHPTGFALATRSATATPGLTGGYGHSEEKLWKRTARPLPSDPPGAGFGQRALRNHDSRCGVLA